MAAVQAKERPRRVRALLISRQGELPFSTDFSPPAFGPTGAAARRVMRLPVRRHRHGRHARGHVSCRRGNFPFFDIAGCGRDFAAGGRPRPGPPAGHRTGPACRHREHTGSAWWRSCRGCCSASASTPGRAGQGRHRGGPAARSREPNPLRRLSATCWTRPSPPPGSPISGRSSGCRGDDSLGLIGRLIATAPTLREALRDLCINQVRYINGAVTYIADQGSVVSGAIRSRRPRCAASTAILDTAVGRRIALLAEIAARAPGGGAARPCRAGRSLGLWRRPTACPFSSTRTRPA